MKNLTPAKKNTRSKKNNNGTKVKGKSESDLRAEYSALGPMRLRKYAISGLNIPAEVADGWNDFDFMVDYCVKKASGGELPEQPQEQDVDFDDDEEESEFDASDLVGENDDEEDDEEESETEGSVEFPFTAEDDEEDEEEEADPEPEPPKPKKTSKPRKSKKRVEEVEAVEPTGNDVNVVIGQLLDVITNQGVALETLSKSNARLESTCKEMYIRQEANHSALSTLAKSVFSMSAMMSEYVPKTLKVMRFKPSAIKEIRNKADSAGVDAKELFDSLMDPDAESEVD